jgi:hypothetical protein
MEQARPSKENRHSLSGSVSFLTGSPESVILDSMPRTKRLEYPGAIDHGMSRDDRRERIDVDDVDRQGFLKPLAATCQNTERKSSPARLAIAARLGRGDAVDASDWGPDPVGDLEERQRPVAQVDEAACGDGLPPRPRVSRNEPRHGLTPHLEQLDPKTGRVIQNIHLRWPEGGER